MGCGGELFELFGQGVVEVAVEQEPAVAQEGFEGEDAAGLVAAVAAFDDRQVPRAAAGLAASAFGLEGFEQEALEGVGFDAEGLVSPAGVQFEGAIDLAGGGGPFEPDVEQVEVAVGIDADGGDGGEVASGVAAEGGVEESEAAEGVEADAGWGELGGFGLFAGAGPDAGFAEQGIAGGFKPAIVVEDKDASGVGPGLVLFFLVEGGAAVGFAHELEGIVILLVGPEDLGAAEHLGAVSIEEGASLLGAVRVFEVVVASAPGVPEVVAVGLAQDGAEQARASVGSAM